MDSSSSESDKLENGGSTGILIDFSDEHVIPMPPALLTFAEVDDTFGIFHLPPIGINGTQSMRKNSNRKLESPALRAKSAFVPDYVSLQKGGLHPNETLEGAENLPLVNLLDSTVSLVELPDSSWNDTFGIFNSPATRGNTGKPDDLAFGACSFSLLGRDTPDYITSCPPDDLDIPDPTELVPELEGNEGIGSKQVSVDSEILDVKTLSFSNATKINDVDFSIEVPKDDIIPPENDTKQTLDADIISPLVDPEGPEVEANITITVAHVEECENDPGVTSEEMENPALGVSSDVGADYVPFHAVGLNAKQALEGMENQPLVDLPDSKWNDTFGIINSSSTGVNMSKPEPDDLATGVCSFLLSSGDPDYLTSYPPDDPETPGLTGVVVELEGIESKEVSVDSELLDVENLSFFNATNINDADFSIEVPKDLIPPENYPKQTIDADIITTLVDPHEELEEANVTITVAHANECERDSSIKRTSEELEVKSSQVSHWPHIYRSPVATLESIRRQVEEIFKYDSPSEAVSASASAQTTMPVPEPSQMSPANSPSVTIKERTPVMKVKPIPFQLLTSPIKGDPLPTTCPESTSRSRISKTLKRPAEVSRTPQTYRSRTPVRLEFNAELHSQPSTAPELKFGMPESDNELPAGAEVADNNQAVKNTRKIQLPTFRFGGFHKNKGTGLKAVVQPLKAMISSEASKAAASAAISPTDTNIIVPRRGKFIPPIASSSPIAKTTTTTTASECGTPSKSRRNSTVKSSGYGRQSVNMNMSGSGSTLNTSKIPPPSPVRLRHSFSQPPSPIGPRQSVTLPSPNRPRQSISQPPSPVMVRQTKIQPPCPIGPRQSNIPPTKGLDKLRVFTRMEPDPSKLKKVFFGTSSLRLPFNSSKENRPRLSQVFAAKK